MNNSLVNLDKTSNQSIAPNIWLERGNELASLGAYEEALSSFDRAVAIQATNNAAWVQRAVVLIHLNRHKEALNSCDRALEIDNSDRQAWLFRGAALNHLGRYQECYASYDKSLGIERQTIRQKLSIKLKGLWFNSAQIKIA
ncbi:MAG: tetratricopeptide repeat protein [Chroococcus sp. CMT-3BRIN-NPC107]|jgi:tetratricopeptide (TPR) repeat protein|nr:tetratricopeptide repeat protein [Chroococcus sp. CMT-3BRIN-NPC107]